CSGNQCQSVAEVEDFLMSCAAVLDVRMRNVLLCMLGFFLLSSLLNGHADAGIVGREMEVSREGVYHHRREKGGPALCPGPKRGVSIQRTVPIKPSLIQEPNRSQIFKGETVTLTCEIQGGGGTQWTYKWIKNKLDYYPASSEYRIIGATKAHSGEYSCRGKGDNVLTEWSNVINITVSEAVLSASPSWLSPGASVTLSCEVRPQSAGWRFFWYKAVPKPSKRYQPSYSFELLPGSTNGTEQNSYIIHGPTHTAGYVCRAEGEEPGFDTLYSELKFVWSADPHPAASLSVSPDRVQHFSSDSMSLSCKGNSTEWRLRRFRRKGYLADFSCSLRRENAGATCTFVRDWYHSGVFWCESESGEFSNAVNITVQSRS
ncbi:hypothetical protein AMECASPLE_018774, partial [Ameca splendens]